MGEHAPASLFTTSINEEHAMYPSETKMVCGEALSNMAGLQTRTT